jgi:hypothetical protein
METVETKEIGKYLIEIYPDQDTESPRNWDNLGTMICFHRRYNLGDKNDIIDADDFNSWDEQRRWIEKKIKPAVILPLYLYDHSGITMNTTGFSCRWDSGQVGWILVSKEKVKKEYGVKKITKELIEKVTRVLEGEVNTYDQYLTGDVYGYRIFEIETCELGHEHKEEIDSCWGYYGVDECMSEAEGVVKYYIEKENSVVS